MFCLDCRCTEWIHWQQSSSYSFSGGVSWNYTLLASLAVPFIPELFLVFFVAVHSARKERSALKSIVTCQICLTRPVQILFLICRHFVTCSECAEKVRDCPLCHQDIAGTLDVFLCWTCVQWDCLTIACERKRPKIMHCQTSSNKTPYAMKVVLIRCLLCFTKEA